MTKKKLKTVVLELRVPNNFKLGQCKTCTIGCQARLNDYAEFCYWNIMEANEIKK